MPRKALRQLAGKRRSARANRRLGLLLAFVAGAVNAGGFLAVERYTSHMTGILSAVADDLALGLVSSALAGCALVAAFVLGAMTTAILTNWARHRALHSEYALSLLLEAFLLLLFGALGAWLSHLTALFVPATVVLLCFIMGLQNAVITKISQAVIRTTHMTGVVTDLGIELGRLVYRNGTIAPTDLRFVRADRSRMVLLGSLLACFVVGGVIGALMFQRWSFAATIPFAAVLATVALVPVTDDLSSMARRRSRQQARGRVASG